MDFKEIQRARELLSSHLPISRMIPAPSLSREAGAEVFLKLESELPTSSFKPRGALHTLLRRLEHGPVAGVVTASTGNHGAAVAWAARRLHLPAAVFLPENSNAAKRARIAAEGAEIIEVGAFLELSRERAERFARERGWFLIVDGRDYDLTIGAATLALEILDQLPSADAIFVPVGDSSLIRGIAFAAKHAKPGLRIIGIQAEGAPAYYRSWNERRVVCTDFSDTIADGIAVRQTLAENVQQLCELVDEMKLVSDKQMLAAISRLLLEEHVLAEPAGAAATTALLASGKSYAGKTVVLLVSGANIAPEILQRAINAS